jgi:regulatory protein
MALWDLQYEEKVDKLKTRVLKYVVYKKRSCYEVREKFKDEDQDILEEVISRLTELGYIDDLNYVERSINEFFAIKNMSLKEITYKLISKGINKNIIDDYIYNHKDELLDYEIKSAKNIIIKKQNQMEPEDIKNYLFKKGYMSETIKLAFEDF